MPFWMKAPPILIIQEKDSAGMPIPKRNWNFHHWTGLNINTVLEIHGKATPKNPNSFMKPTETK